MNLSVLSHPLDMISSIWSVYLQILNIIYLYLSDVVLSVIWWWLWVGSWFRISWWVETIMYNCWTILFLQLMAPLEILYFCFETFQFYWHWCCLCLTLISEWVSCTYLTLMQCSQFLFWFPYPFLCLFVNLLLDSCLVFTKEGRKHISQTSSCVISL